jgi:acyl transferase domain-containing protein
MMMTTDTTEIGIYGMSCRFPVGDGDGPEQFWAALMSGADGISTMPQSRWNTDAWYDADRNAPNKMYVREGGFVQGLDQFDARAFGISPAEAKQMDPQQRLLLEVGYDALHRAGYTRETLTGQSIGVFVGTQHSGWGTTVNTATDVTGYSGAGGYNGIVANRMSYVFGVEGPSMTVDTACSSSLVALNLACQALRAGECDAALVAGVNVNLHPGAFVATCKAGMLSPTTRCRTFDAGADGYAKSEGCGAVVLRRVDIGAGRHGDTDVVESRNISPIHSSSSGAETAQKRRCYGIVRATVVNQDGRSASLTAPNGLAQQAMHRRALMLAAVPPSELSMIETHGTGTALGDPIEVESLAAVYGGNTRDSATDPALVLGEV